MQIITPINSSRDGLGHASYTGQRVAVAILGARMHYAVPTVLAMNDRLEKIYSDIYFSGDGVGRHLQKILLQSPVGALRRLALRFEEQLPSGRVHTFPFLGMVYILALQMATREQSRERIFERFAAWFGAAVSRAGFGKAVAVYGMNAASLEIFNYASDLELTCILEQCSAPYAVMNRLFEEEYDLWSTWEKTQSMHFSDRLARREAQEWELADMILAGSSFVIENLVKLGVPEYKCILVPYAVNVAEFTPMDQKRARSAADRLNVLFLGGVGLRKGIQYLYSALGRLKGLEITARAAGSVLVKPNIAHQLSERMELLGLVPRSEVRNLLGWADVLVLPSISEGSALVTYEALASGVPVITTPNAGSPVQDSVTGFIVPNRNAEAIAERLEQMAQNPDLLREMSTRARQYAEEYLSWDAYSQRLLQAIETAIYRHAN